MDGVRRFALGLMVLLAGATLRAQSTGGQPPPAPLTPEQAKLLSRRAAEADAYRKLAETVNGLQINSRTYVRDFVAESDEMRGAVDTMIRGIRLGTPTWYDDGSCEVPAEVTVSQVIQTLRDAHDRHYKGSDIKTSDFESMASRIHKQVVRVVGSGAPRTDLPPNLPAGVAQQLGAPPAAPPGPPQPFIPDIWRQLGPQGRLMAIRAARLDALRRLAERIKGLRLTSRTAVRDFVAETDEIRTELDALLKGAAEVGQPFLRHDELIAEVTMVVPTEQVITTVKALHSRHYKGDDVRGSDIDTTIRSVVQRDFEATGMGVPPPQFVRRFAQQTGVELPDWAAETLEATGEGRDPDFGTAQGRLRAARAAELIARQRLADRVAALRLPGNLSVRDLIARSDEVALQLDGVIANATPGPTRFNSDGASVTVSAPGMEVWGIVNEQLKRERR